MRRDCMDRELTAECIKGVVHRIWGTSTYFSEEEPPRPRRSAFECTSAVAKREMGTGGSGGAALADELVETLADEEEEEEDAEDDNAVAMEWDVVARGAVGDRLSSRIWTSLEHTSVPRRSRRLPLDAGVPRIPSLRFLAVVIVLLEVPLPAPVPLMATSSSSSPLSVLPPGVDPGCAIMPNACSALRACNA